MQITESVVVQVANPNKCKLKWLKETSDKFTEGVKLGLELTEGLNAVSRKQIHCICYRPIRELGLISGHVIMVMS